MENTLKVIAVNVSKKTGTIKKPVDQIVLSEIGIEGDAHSGTWHRQLSLLGVESVKKLEQSMDRAIEPGEFAENITTEGVELYKLPLLSTIQNDNITLQVTQIGKKCHGSTCAIFRESGDCVMPREGIFTRVIKGGVLKAGDEFYILSKKIKALVITLSDRASKGEYKDISGPLLNRKLKEYIESIGWEYASELIIIPDEISELQEIINSKYMQFDIIFTTGSTGIGPRDIAPEAVQPLLDKEIPGIMEFIRVKYGAEKHNALLSRGVAGVKNKTLVYALPGSPKAIEEYTSEIFKTIKHSILMINAIDSH